MQLHLEKVKTSSNVELVKGYARHLAKVSQHGKSEEERGEARQSLLSLQLNGAYVERKREGVTPGSAKQVATAKKMGGFSTFDTKAMEVLKPSPQTPPRAIPAPRQDHSNTSPQGSPPPAKTPLASTSPEGSPPPATTTFSSTTPPKYRPPKPAEALLARVVGTSWDNFWKVWLKFETQCTEEELGSLTIWKNNASRLDWNPSSFELVAKFLNAHPSYKQFDLTFSDYKPEDVANFLPQVDCRNDLDVVLRNEEEYSLLAKALFKNSLYEVSRNILEKAAKRNPSYMKSCDFLTRLGQVYNKLDPANSQKAEGYYKESLKINPNHFLTWFHFSFFSRTCE